MSEVQVKKLRQNKLPSVPENSVSPDSSLKCEPAKKPRASRAKKPPTKQEAMDMLSNGAKVIREAIQDLKEDQVKCSSMPLKKVNELIGETLNNLQEDLEDIQENLDQLKLLPDQKSE